jgi:hypothetical protein
VKRRVPTTTPIGDFQTELYSEIRRDAFGNDIGQNSWLTAEEQDLFLSWLDLSTGKTLLDPRTGYRNGKVIGI